MKGELIMEITKKNIKRLFFIVLSLIIVMSHTAVIQASDSNEYEITPRYTTISYTTVYFEINGIKANCSASVAADKSTSLKIKMEIQKKSSGTYSTVETWTTSKTGTSLFLSESRLINVLYDYRLKVTFTAGTETATVYKYPT